MNKFERFTAFIKNRYFFWLNPDPKSLSIDRTGIVWSDYPKIGNGWMKGFLLNTPSRDIIVTAKHCAPSIYGPNNKIFFVDKLGHKIERTIIAVNKDDYKLDGVSVNCERKLGRPENFFSGGDVALAKLDQPLPLNITAYDICRDNTILRRRSTTFNQFQQPSIAQIQFSSDIAWVWGRRRNLLLKGGDSGLPWFIWNKKTEKWEVLTVTSRGEWGEGPWLGHKNIYNDLINRIYSLK